MFRAPDDSHAARALWVFLVENLKPGHVVELSSGAAELTRPSGEKIPAPLYEKIMEKDYGVIGVS
jgi:hypothetical protein